MKKNLSIILSVLVVAFLAIQFVPVKRDNPQAVGDLDAPSEVKAIIKRSCYDCHSNETRWPWYSYVAPASWLVTSDVVNGRKHVNFSNWSTYSEKRRNKIKEHVVEETSEGEMPLPIYLQMHPDAKITPEELKVLSQWMKNTFGESGKE